MRLLAWNIRQGGGSRLPRIADALKRQDADIVVLSEYRGGPSATRLCSALQALGYRHATTLVPPPSRNGVLVVAAALHPRTENRQSSKPADQETGWYARASGSSTCCA